VTPAPAQGQPPLCKCGHTVTEHIGGAHWPLIPVGSQIGHDEPFYGYCTHGDVIDKCKCTRFRPKHGQPWVHGQTVEEWDAQHAPASGQQALEAGGPEPAARRVPRTGTEVPEVLQQRDSRPAPAPASGQPCPLGEPDDGFAPGCEVCHREPCPARLRPYSLIAAGRAIPPEEPAPAQGQPRSVGDLFVAHIQQHLEPGQVVICKICGKSVDEIAAEQPREGGRP